MGIGLLDKLRIEQLTLINEELQDIIIHLYPNALNITVDNSARTNRLFDRCITIDENMVICFDVPVCGRENVANPCSVKPSLRSHFSHVTTSRL